MKKSEKILLSVLGVVVLWAAYILFFEEPPVKVAPTAQNQSGEFEGIVAALQASLDEGQLTDIEAYKVDLAKQGLGGGPFYASTAQFYFAGGDGLDGDGENALVYSGYLKVGKASFAIINGIEYAVGDELATGGFRLVQITHGYVVVERREPSTGRAFKRQIPLAEDNVDDVTLKAVY